MLKGAGAEGRFGAAVNAAVNAVVSTAVNAAVNADGGERRRTDTGCAAKRGDPHDEGRLGASVLVQRSISAFCFVSKPESSGRLV